jgi:glycine/D-amino acid oxidase-like deaminating enzyme
VFDRTTVTGYEQRDGGVRLSTDRNHSVRAKKIAFASGYESQQYLKRKVAKLISTFAFVSEPVSGDAIWRDECLIWESAEPYVYLRTTEANAGNIGMRRVIMGGEDEDFRNPELRDKLISYKTRKLLGKFQKLFPEFGVELEAAFAWAGTFGKTKDGLAYIGEAEDFPNAYFALGYGGNGITYSVIAAEIIRDAVLGKVNPQADLFRFDR